MRSQAEAWEREEQEKTEKRELKGKIL